MYRQPERPDRVRPQGARRRSGQSRAASASPSARPSRTRSRHPGTKYSLGSVLNHVCLHQTVIGQEAIKQMEMAGEEPDVLIGCAGGGSNFAGIAFPFLQRNQGAEEAPHCRRRAGVLPVADQGRTALRFRRHGQDDAADDDVHARPRLHAAEHPRRRTALSRHVADGQPRANKLGLIEARPYRRRRSSRRPCSLPARRASCRRRNRRTPSRRDRRGGPGREEGRKKVIVFNLSGHGLLILPPTTPTSPARCVRPPTKSEPLFDLDAGNGLASQRRLFNRNPIVVRLRSRFAAMSR